MYSVVLMAALSTTSSAPEWGHHAYRNPCYGYTGVGYTCRGGSHCYGGCFGYNACYGYGNWGHNWGYGWPYGTGCTGCYGCYGGYSCYGVPVPEGVTYIGPRLSSPDPVRPIEVTPDPKIKKGTDQTRAKVRIEIPADAKLYVDGMLMKTTSAVRLFQTPALEPNQTYYYEVKAELIRNGQSFSEVQQIVVRPGEQISASFAGLEQRAVATTQR
jgi:uncharacterized protein (TIGR03000 family)